MLIGSITGLHTKDRFKFSFAHLNPNNMFKYYRCIQLNNIVQKNNNKENKKNEYVNYEMVCMGRGSEFDGWK